MDFAIKYVYMEMVEPILQWKALFSVHVEKGGCLKQNIMGIWIHTISLANLLLGFLGQHSE